jgi:hypothetical protein
MNQHLRSEPVAFIDIGAQRRVSARRSTTPLRAC